MIRQSMYFVYFFLKLAWNGLYGLNLALTGSDVIDPKHPAILSKLPADTSIYAKVGRHIVDHKGLIFTVRCCIKEVLHLLEW